MTTNGRRVIVAGSINMDVVVTADRHPKIGETVPGHDLHFFPGGKGANQAVAAARLGARTQLIGKLGGDAFGDELMSFLARQGVDVTRITRTTEASTGTAVIVVAKKDNSIVVVPGANDLLTSLDVSEPTIEAGDILVSQFEVPERTIRDFFEGGHQRGATTVLNPAPAKACSRDVLSLPDVIVVNETELAFFLGVNELGVVSEAARRFRLRDGQTIVVTLGAEGAVAVVGDRELRVPGRVVTAIDSTGAGDCYVGALVARLASGATIDDAVRYANLAASLSVQRLGASSSMPTAAEVEATFSSERRA